DPAGPASVTQPERRSPLLRVRRAEPARTAAEVLPARWSRRGCLRRLDALSDRGGLRRHGPRRVDLHGVRRGDGLVVLCRAGLGDDSPSLGPVPSPGSGRGGLPGDRLDRLDQKPVDRAGGRDASPGDRRAGGGRHGPVRPGVRGAVGRVGGQVWRPRPEL
ncbi:MAG: hypothetical protein AVDCRST_MAG33-47, partial [uncultured Thermomicrobiales bacterium]